MGYQAVFLSKEGTSMVSNDDKYPIKRESMDAAVLAHTKEGSTYEDWEEFMLNLLDKRKA